MEKVIQLWHILFSIVTAHEGISNIFGRHMCEVFIKISTKFYCFLFTDVFLETEILYNKSLIIMRIVKNNRVMIHFNFYRYRPWRCMKRILQKKVWGIYKNTYQVSLLPFHRCIIGDWNTLIKSLIIIRIVKNNGVVIHFHFCRHHL